MKLHSQHATGDCPVPLTARRSTLPAARCCPGSRSAAASQASPPAPRLRARDLALTATAVSAAAGTLYWHSPRSPLISLGLALIVALTGTAAAWLHAREKTRQVQAREHGATQRELIRHYPEIELAEAQEFLLRAAACGPSSTSDNAAALRADARKALELWPPTAVKDAMRITRLQDPPGLSAHPSAPEREPGPAPNPTAPAP